MTSILVLFFGASIGSFAYAFALRFSAKKPWVFARSRCKICGNVLSWKELLPVISFSVQRGRCKNCGNFIGWSYLGAEIFMALAFFRLWENIGLLYGYNFLVFKAVFLFVFFAIAVIDLKSFIIPDKLIILGGAAAVLFKLLNPDLNPSISNSIIASIIASLIFFSIWAVSGGRQIGLGDVKLIALMGFLFGFPGILWVIYIAVSVGIAVSVYLLAAKKATLKTPLPFGALLSGASILYILFSSFIDSFFSNILLY